MSERPTWSSVGSWKGPTLAGLLAGVVLSSCAAAPFLIPSILEFGRNLLITSNSNYGNKYREDMNQLLMSVSRSWVNTPYPQRYAMGGQLGQPGMPFPGQMGQPMPGQPMPGFPGGGDPNNPFGQQGQPGMPFPGQQGMPGQPMPGMPMPGFAGGPDPNNPFGQSMPGQPMSGMTGPMPPSGTVPGYPGSPPPPVYPGSGMPAYPGQPQPGFPQGQQFPPQSYPPQPGAPFPGQPGAMYPQSPGSPYPDPNNPYSQYPGGMSQGQQGHQGYPSSNPSMGNAFPGGMSPQQPGMNQGYPGGMPGASPGMPGSPYYDPNNPYGQNIPGAQPGFSGYPPGGAQNSGFPNQGMAGNPNQPWPPSSQPGMPNQPQAYGGNPAMGMPGQAGMPQPGYPPMPSHGSPYGQPPQQGFPQAQPNFQGGPSQGYPPVGGYPAMAYQGMPMPRGIGPVVGPMEVDVALLRQVTTASGKHVTIMQDGETLKDGRGNPQLGDKFKIVFRTNTDCFMYVIAIDGSGWAQGLWPGQGTMGNPVVKEKEYTFPEGDQWFSLDQVRGIETIYLIASPGQRPDIEESLTKLVGAERPAVRPVAQVQEPAILPSGFGATLLAGQPTPVKLENGRQLEITPTTYRAAQPGDDVRVTRWFKHD